MQKRWLHAKYRLHKKSDRVSTVQAECVYVTVYIYTTVCVAPHIVVRCVNTDLSAWVGNACSAGTCTPQSRVPPSGSSAAAPRGSQSSFWHHSGWTVPPPSSQSDSVYSWPYFHTGKLKKNYINSIKLCWLWECVPNIKILPREQMTWSTCHSLWGCSGGCTGLGGYRSNAAYQS